MPNKLISLLLAVCILFCLSACGTIEATINVKDTLSELQTDNTPSTEAGTIAENNYNQASSAIENSNTTASQSQTTLNHYQPTSTVEPSSHIHSYSNATCTSPKKCNCGATAGTELGHQFSSATCTSPQICNRCGTVTGTALGHSYLIANCISPKTCTRCGQTSGNALGHKYVNNKCSRCGKIDPDSLPVSLNELYIIDSKYYKYQNNITDSFGNTYNGAHAFSHTYQSNNGKEPHSTFSLNGKYNSFNGSIVATTEPAEDATYYINIYVDNVLKFSKTGYSKFTGKIDFDINVKNAQSLKIAVGIEQLHKGKNTYEIAIVNARLLK